MPASTQPCSFVPAVFLVGADTFQDLDMPNIYRVAQSVLGRDFRSLSINGIMVRFNGLCENKTILRCKKRIKELRDFLQNYYNKTPGLVELKPSVNLTPVQANSTLRLKKKGR